MVSPLEALLGDTIGGTYLVQRELGGGGMSRVFLAEERALGRQVVIKVLAPELAEGLSAERFAREITVAAGLQQPNIVPVLTAGDSRRSAVLHDAVHRGTIAARSHRATGRSRSPRSSRS